MAELSSSIQPVPVPYSDNPRHLLDWAMRLVSWLTFLGEIEYPLEESLSLGGPGMASRMFGFEHSFSAPDTNFQEILGAPEAGKKRILTYIRSTYDADAVDDLLLVKKVDTTEYVIATHAVAKNEIESAGDFTQIVLDGEDETLGIKSALDAGAYVVVIYGTYLDVD